MYKRQYLVIVRRDAEGHSLSDTKAVVLLTSYVIREDATIGLGLQLELRLTEYATTQTLLYGYGEEDVYKRQQHPVELCYGLIETVDPLQIRVDQALVLQREMLILPTDFMPQVGQFCLLLRMQGGQRYALLYICALEEDSKT